MRPDGLSINILEPILVPFIPLYLRYSNVLIVGICTRVYLILDEVALSFTIPESEKSLLRPRWDMNPQHLNS